LAKWVVGLLLNSEPLGVNSSIVRYNRKTAIHFCLEIAERDEKRKGKRREKSWKKKER
jgi:hypothetical protein